MRRFCFALLFLAYSAADSRAQLQTFWHGPRAERQVTLTFDDAPFEPHTASILKILDRYNARATFFVVGKHARNWPASVTNILDKGHEIGNHTEMHRPLAGLDKKIIRTEILSLQSHLQTTYGIIPRFFRPPQGLVSYETLLTVDESGMDLVFWDVDPQDWTSPGMIHIARNIADHVRPGSIILLHTLTSEIVETLPILLEYLKQDGYRIVPLSILLSRPAYQTPKSDTQTARRSE